MTIFINDGPEDQQEVLINVGVLKTLLRHIVGTSTPAAAVEPVSEDALAKIHRMANMLGYKLIPFAEAMAVRAVFQQGEYEHTFMLSFTARSNLDDGEDMTSEMWKNAIYRRMEDLDSNGEAAWQEALLPPEPQ